MNFEKLGLENFVKEQNLDTISFHELYYGISIENYELYKQYSSEFTKISDNISWEIDNPKNNINDYILSWQNKKITGTITIVFQALAVEAYINHYGALKIGRTKYNDHYERIDTKDKYIIIYELINKIPFPKNGKIYENLDMLLQIRNRIVHSKTHKINYENSSLQDFCNSMNIAMENDIFKDINNIVQTYPQLLSIMKI